MTHAVHLHLDPMGGAAGDMFVAAMLSAYPEHAGATLRAAQAASGVECRLLDHGDGVLTGRRFDVQAHHHEAHDHGHHGHIPWRDLRARLEAIAVAPGVRDHAIGVFTQLAAAEAKVHGVAPEQVTFHEVGSTDSLADIVAAAALIDAVGAASWSVAALPLGGGRVRTAHGPMPVPAPATTLLLEGFDVVDDGIGGERVTPTGAAILRHLGCGPRPRGPLRLGRTGIGFGTKALPGISNVLRVLAFETADAEAAASPHRELAVIAFEVDDQSGEDLAAGLERVRAVPGVHDVTQAPVFGKKSRLAVQVQVLVRPDALEDAVAACFAETTTIGLRTHLVQGRALKREMREVEVDGRRVRVKLVDRPGGRTGKAEADDAVSTPVHATRARLRRTAEQLANEVERA